MVLLSRFGTQCVVGGGSEHYDGGNEFDVGGGVGGGRRCIGL